VGMWCQRPAMVDSAQAGIPDSGQQLDEGSAQLKEVNANLQGISETLVSGGMKVQVMEMTETKKKAAPKAVPAVPAAAK